MLIRDMTLEDCDALEPLREDPALAIDPRGELGGRLTRAWVACVGPSPVGSAAVGSAPVGSVPVGSVPVGYALGWWVVDELQLLALGVLPSARRAGVGQRLLEHVLSATFAAGGRRVLLEVARGNVPARTLYERAGFRVLNVRAGYYRATGDDALEMERLASG